jgi:hypothetical protein
MIEIYYKRHIKDWYGTVYDRASFMRMKVFISDVDKNVTSAATIMNLLEF